MAAGEDEHVREAREGVVHAAVRAIGACDLVGRRELGQSKGDVRRRDGCEVETALVADEVACCAAIPGDDGAAAVRVTGVGVRDQRIVGQDRHGG